MNDQRKLLEMKLLIDKCDGEFAARLENIALDILSKKNVRLVRLSGPTCSGKTTAATMLTKAFAERGKRAITVSIDDFYIDTHILLSNSQKKGLGKIDYDSAETIDIVELKRFVCEIFESNEVHCPVFDFKSGRRSGYRTLNVGKNDIVIFEGIQAVYPEVTAMFEGYSSLGIFISPVSALKSGENAVCPNDIRLMRRLVRDHKYRNTSPSLTFKLWEGVRSNEESSIFPFADACEYKVDSTMPYELGVLRPYLETILAQIKENEDCFDLAQSILLSVKCVEIIPDYLVGEDSLYKEFI